MTTMMAVIIMFVKVVNSDLKDEISTISVRIDIFKLLYKTSKQVSVR